LLANHAAAADAWRSQVLTLREQGDRLRQTVESLTKTLEEAREELAAKDRGDRGRLNLLKRAMRLQGKVWERKVLQGAPRFHPLSERHAPIISVLNLKGGVGKTTVTAHLGAALSGKGYRVLLSSTSVRTPQVSGQSCGQAPRTRNGVMRSSSVRGEGKASRIREGPAGLVSSWS
jgi:Mrp family chromosome partitioning ATPase